MYFIFIPMYHLCVCVYIIHRFRCNICDKTIKCDHMGKPDVVKHMQTQGHKDRAQSMKSQTTIHFKPMASNEDIKRIEAELKMSVLTACSNVPLAFHDSLSPMIRNVSPDSKVASKYRSASTKATCMLNLAVAPTLIANLLETMRVHPFSLSVDGSNDTGLEKMNPLTVRI